jgi:transposase-like protein
MHAGTASASHKTAIAPNMNFATKYAKCKRGNKPKNHVNPGLPLKKPRYKCQSLNSSKNKQTPLFLGTSL